MEYLQDIDGTVIHSFDRKHVQTAAVDQSVAALPVFVFLEKVGQLKKGFFTDELASVALPKKYAYPTLYFDKVALYMENYFLPGLHKFLLNRLSALPTASNAGDLLNVNYVAAVNNIITQLHIANSYYCFQVSRTTGLDKAIAESKKVIVVTYANWMATAFTNVVKRFGGAIELKATSVKASNVTKGIEVYNWQGAVKEANFKAFAVNASRPYDISVGTVAELPKPVQVELPQNTAPSAAILPQMNEKIITMVPEPVKNIASTASGKINKVLPADKPSKWWLWLAGAAAAGYILKGAK